MAEERARAEALRPGEAAIILQDLCKVYPREARKVLLPPALSPPLAPWRNHRLKAEQALELSEASVAFLEWCTSIVGCSTAQDILPYLLR